MKSKMLFFTVVVMAAILSACSDDNEAKLNEDPDVVHEGEKWTIASIDNYSLMDVSTTGVFSKTG
jgi:outer membrane biogenesis lipoprotein LolB